MTIVKRLVKGSELTHAELDGNFTDLDERVGTLELGGGGGGKILQVLSVTKRDVFTTTATTFADITGLSLTITPSSDTSKILVFANVVVSPGPSAATSTLCFLRIERADNAFIGAGDAAGVRVRTSGVGRGMFDLNGVLPSSFSVLDAPNTTLPMTYKVTAYGESGGALRINASGNDMDQAIAGHRSISTLTLMEVAA